MYDDGYEHIDNIDISSVVIEQMKVRNSSRKSMTYKEMDARDLKFQNDFYDLVVDKSTIDSLLCGEQAYYSVSLMIKVINLKIICRKCKES